MNVPQRHLRRINRIPVVEINQCYTDVAYDKLYHINFELASNNHNNLSVAFKEPVAPVRVEPKEEESFRLGCLVVDAKQVVELQGRL